ncbi:MAG TPA: PHP domain-containing protein [Ktedonobacterales bacterium]|nr:PHP domain-containing protein [Ktedonobacterales bacterium]
MNEVSITGTDALDLQIHTVYSDGQWEPSALFTHLEGAGFRLVAITDHDTCEHVEELCRLGAAHGVAVLPAMEVTTEWRGVSAHLLCYAPHGFGPSVSALTQRTVAAQLENTRAVHAELLRRGYEFPNQAKMLGGRSEPTRPIDNASLLFAHGHVADLQSGLVAIQEAGYRQIAAPLAEAVAAAHTDGALAVIAHPGRGGGEIHRYEPAELAVMLEEIPLDGIEAYYPTHTEAQVAAFRALAERRGLLVSAGSDSHGPRQRLPIRYPASSVAALLDRCGVTVTTGDLS